MIRRIIYSNSHQPLATRLLSLHCMMRVFDVTRRAFVGPTEMRRNLILIGTMPLRSRTDSEGSGFES